MTRGKKIFFGFLAVAVVVVGIILISNYVSKQNDVTAFENTAPGEKLSSKRITSAEATSMVWKKRNTDRVYIHPSFVNLVDRYVPNAPLYVGGKPNKFLAKLQFIRNYEATGELNKWLVQKDDEGYYFKDIGGIVNLLQFGDQSSNDPDEFNHWFQVDQWGAADWYHYDPLSGASAIDLNKVPVRD